MFECTIAEATFVAAQAIPPRSIPGSDGNGDDSIPGRDRNRDHSMSE